LFIIFMNLGAYHVFKRKINVYIFVQMRSKLYNVVVGFLGGPKKTPTFKIGHNARIIHCSSRPIIS
jgi:hypothetical protein